MMFMLPGCKCCSKCSTISRASSVEVSLAGQDFLQQFTFKHKYAIAQYPADYEHAVTDAFRGSSYNGTFSLSKTLDTGTTSTWVYQWGDNAPTCGTPSITVVLTDAATSGDQVIYVQLNVFGMRYVDMDSTTPKGINDFSCTLSSIVFSGNTISGVLNGLAEGQNAASRTCAQIDSAIAFGDQVVSWPVFPSYSDESGRGTYTITSESLPSDTTLYTPTYSSSTVVRYPIVKLLGIAVT